MISHSSKQGDLARAVSDAVAVAGHSPKLDCLDLKNGERWHETIAWWLSVCDSAIVLLCPDAVDSPWVRYELSVLSNRDIDERTQRSPAQSANDRAQTDFELVLAYLGGTRAAVTADPSFRPYALSAIHSTLDLELEDDHVLTASVIVQSMQLQSPMSPAHLKLVGEAIDRVRHAPANRLNSSRQALRDCMRARNSEAFSSFEDDEWAYDMPGLVASDAEEGRCRREFAVDLCAASLDALDEPLSLLARCSTLPDGLDQNNLGLLVDYNVQASLDPSMSAFLAQPTGFCAVLSTSDPATVELVHQSAQFTRRSKMRRIYFLTKTIQGDSPVHVADDLLAELESVVGEREEQSLIEFEAYSQGRGIKVFAVLTRGRGVSSEALTILHKRHPWVHFLMVADHKHAPDTWAAELEAQVIGPHFGHADWPIEVQRESRLMFNRGVLRNDLAREVKEPA
jgi:TIR domain